jgi:hypothetical protein
LPEQLHIVCLDAPSPPDYGGAIDMYYKLRALASTGKKIILHYFDYRKNRGHKGLEAFCVEIHTYSRKHALSVFPFTRPYIIQSRINKKLIGRLNQDDYPVLLEGIHCAGLLPHIKKDRIRVIRLHNDEAVYYANLAEAEKNVWRRGYYLWEAGRLKKFQQRLSRQTILACLSETDRINFRENGFGKTVFIPCFIPWQEVSAPVGKGKYCLYHGNLSVRENESAALWLIENIFSTITLPFVIAGKGISVGLSEAAKPYTHIQLKNDPSIEELDGLVTNAQVHVLPSMNQTGIKLKMLHALLSGRFCITNAAGIRGSAIEDAVVISETKTEWLASVQRLMQVEFTDAHRNERQKILTVYNNIINAEKLNALW